VDLQPVKTAPGRRLRHPDNHKVLACADDAEAAPHLVDLHDPHWFRALACGDIVVVVAETPADTATAEPAIAASATAIPIPSAKPPADAAGTPSPATIKE